jgi:pyruvate,orthophosphate dikinase
LTLCTTVPLMRLLQRDASHIDPVITLLHTAHPDDPKVKERVLGRGRGVSAGAAVGQAVFSVQDAVEYSRRGLKCILVLPQTSADDLEGLQVTIYKC